MVSFTTASSEMLVLCIFSFILQGLIFQFLAYFLFCKKAVKHREMGKYFVTMGAAIFRWREFRYDPLPNSCKIIISKDSLFLRVFFILDMLKLPQKTLVNTQNISGTKIFDSSSIRRTETKYGLRIQFLALVFMIHEVWLNA